MDKKQIIELEAQQEFYSTYYANAGRGFYHSAELTTEKYEQSRFSIAKWLQSKPEEVIFFPTRESIPKAAVKIVSSKELGSMSDFFIAIIPKILQASTNPLIIGGGSVSSVNLNDQELSYVFKEGPAKFEAGTPMLAQVIGFAAFINEKIPTSRTYFGFRKNKEREFPALHNNPKMVYLDNAATTHKPASAIQALATTKSPEALKTKVAKLINAKSSNEISVIPQGTTFGMNLIAQNWGTKNIKPRDFVLTTRLEHHSNLLPWKHHLNCQFIFINPDDKLEHISNIINQYKIKLAVFSTESNVLGPIWGKDFIELKKLIQILKKNSVKVVLDAAQSIGSKKIDVQKLGADWVAFSAHKAMGPTNLGIIWSQNTNHDKDNPLLKRLSLTHEASMFCKSLDYLETLSSKKLEILYDQLRDETINFLNTFEKVTILSNKKSGNIVSFYVDGFHSHDLASMLAEEGISVRAGHHCAQTLHNNLKIKDSVRISFYAYNKIADVEKLKSQVKSVININSRLSA